MGVGNSAAVQLGGSTWLQAPFLQPDSLCSVHSLVIDIGREICITSVPCVLK